MLTELRNYTNSIYNRNIIDINDDIFTIFDKIKNQNHSISIEILVKQKIFEEIFNNIEFYIKNNQLEKVSNILFYILDSIDISFKNILNKEIDKNIVSNKDVIILFEIIEKLDTKYFNLIYKYDMFFNEIFGNILKDNTILNTILQKIDIDILEKSKFQKDFLFKIVGNNVGNIRLFFNENYYRKDITVEISMKEWIAVNRIKYIKDEINIYFLKNSKEKDSLHNFIAYYLNNDFKNQNFYKHLFLYLPTKNLNISLSFDDDLIFNTIKSYNKEKDLNKLTFMLLLPIKKRFINSKKLTRYEYNILKDVFNNLNNIISTSNDKEKYKIISCIKNNLSETIELFNNYKKVIENELVEKKKID